MRDSKLQSGEIFATAPCRADLAGGTIDLWPLYLFHPGALTINLALNIQTSCRLQPKPGKAIHLRSLDTGREERFDNLTALAKAKKYRHPLAAYLVRFFAPEQGVLLETNSESPAGAGISGSSALMIATASALARFTGRKVSLEELRVIAQNVETQNIKVPTGCQDYYPALYGGVSAIHLAEDGIRREAIPVASEEIDSRFALAYTGAPRQSGINNWEVFKAHINGNRRVFHNFEEISRIAREMRAALVRKQWTEVARLIRAEWKLRKTNAPGITTPMIDRLISAALRSGAVAAKVCGAGGGGCVIFMVEPGARSRVEQVLVSSGATVLPLALSRHGVAIRDSRR